MSIVSDLALFGPPRCVVCHARAGWICAGCSSAAKAPSSNLAIPGVARVIAPWSYEGGPRALVLALKVRNMKTAAAPLIDAMARAAQREGLSGDLVAWVPCRPRDRAVRGFDHAEVLARGVAARLGFPSAGVLRRRGRQIDQVGLSRAERFANLAGAFSAAAVENKSVILVDDLVTTGATAASCADALSLAGASIVHLVAACRA